MARRSVSMLSLFLLSASASTGIAFSSFPLYSSSSSRSNHHRSRRPRLDMTSSLHCIPDEDRLRVEGAGGPEREGWAESIAEEFGIRMAIVKAACEAELEQQRASHRLELAQQRVALLENTVPLAAHDAMVESIVGEYSRREEALRTQVEQRDECLHKATTDVRGLSDSLARLKRDLASLRIALSRNDEACRALGAEIRANEVEPEKQRANAAENDLADLRQATHGWLAAAHALKLEAAVDARGSGYADGHADGYAGGYAAGRSELQAARAAFAEQLAAARAETIELVAAAGAAGAMALTQSRAVWMANGRADGLAEAQAAAAAAAAVGGAVEVREAFSAYVVRAHEQKLLALAAERESAGEAARMLSEELAHANGMIAALLKERISDVDSKHDLVLEELATAAAVAAPEKTTDEELPLDAASSGVSPWPLAAAGAAAAAAGAVTEAVKLASTSSFWQECGGPP